ncbi:MAG: ATP-dependent DNA helicase, partial [Pseudomonadota bacterium]
GKTLAYLVPAILSGRRVVVSTGTRTLQDQIYFKDIPLLKRYLDRPFSAALLKGVQNYVCQRRLAQLGQASHPDLALIAAWASRTSTGDCAELAEVKESSPAWKLVTTTPEARLGQRCPYANRCFVSRARRAASSADVIIVNHHLFFADLVLRRQGIPGAQVLPDYDAVVFDEAHQIEDVATEHFGCSASTLRLAALLRDARQALVNKPGNHPSAHADAAKSRELLVNLEARGVELFSAVHAHLLGSFEHGSSRGGAQATLPFFNSDRGGQDPAGSLLGSVPADDGVAADKRLAIPPELFSRDVCGAQWLKLDASLEELALHAARYSERVGEGGGPVRSVGYDRLDSHDSHDGHAHRGRSDRRKRSGTGGNDERQEEAAAISRRAMELRNDLAVLAEGSDRQYVRWAELRSRSMLLHASPIDVGPFLRESLYGSVGSLVLTSATLAAGGRLDYVRQRLGLDSLEATELVLDSPFDYRQQALLYLPTDLPAPNEPTFGPKSLDRIAELLAITQGRALVLFTSHRSLKAAAAELPKRAPYPILVQGNAPRHELLRSLANNVGSVLLATSSFWEGIDVPGEALSLVVLEKLPFAVPDDPLIAARAQSHAERGMDAFRSFQLPRAALTLRQGFGRLIRRKDDRGIVAILDHRIVTKPYGRAFLKSLPEANRTQTIQEVRLWW